MQLKAFAAAFVTAVIVAGVGSAAHAQALSQTTTTSDNNNNVIVASGDTLSGIAKDNGTTYVRLFDANSEIQNPDLIYPKESIRIPKADEQLPDRMAELQTVAPAPDPGPALVSTDAQVSAPPQPAPDPAPAASAPHSGVWDELAQCESGGNWSINTGNGFYGGLQFTMSSWAAVGGSGYPNEASPSEQIARAQMLQGRQGWSAWPVCSVKLGLR